MKAVIEEITLLSSYAKAVNNACVAEVVRGVHPVIQFAEGKCVEHPAITKMANGHKPDVVKVHDIEYDQDGLKHYVFQVLFAKQEYVMRLVHPTMDMVADLFQTQRSLVFAAAYAYSMRRAHGL